eukprot:NODE_911_length_3153_cov_0.222659.p2 type:complete len:238 gc:universal NODE_911_length_3153_cov_0.222659:1001-288(-)
MRHMIKTVKSYRYSGIMDKRLYLTRQFELFNTIAHVEQAHVYHLHNDSGFIGEVAEKNTLSRHILRQFARLTRPFEIDVILDGKHFRIKRPFSFLNSKITISDNNMDIGKVHTDWHIFRRRYDLFSNNNGFRQFGRIDSQFWSWDFVIKDQKSEPRCFINRHFRGMFKEVLTDQGRYEITFEDALIKNPLNISERLIALACAVGIDYDYFSRHSGMLGTNFQLGGKRELPKYAEKEF